MIFALKRPLRHIVYMDLEVRGQETDESNLGESDGREISDVGKFQILKERSVIGLGD